MGGDEEVSTTGRIGGRHSEQPSTSAEMDEVIDTVLNNVTCVYLIVRITKSLRIH